MFLGCFFIGTCRGIRGWASPATSRRQTRACCLSVPGYGGKLRERVLASVLALPRSLLIVTNSFNLLACPAGMGLTLGKTDEVILTANIEFYTHAHETIMGSLDTASALTLTTSWHLSKLWLFLNESQQCRLLGCLGERCCLKCFINDAVLGMPARLPPLLPAYRF